MIEFTRDTKLNSIARGGVVGTQPITAPIDLRKAE